MLLPTIDESDVASLRLWLASQKVMSAISIFIPEGEICRYVLWTGNTWQVVGDVGEESSSTYYLGHSLSEAFRVAADIHAKEIS